MSMGGSPAAEDDTSALNLYASRLPDTEIQRYTDGYRRICRVEATSSSSSSLSPSNAPAPFLHGGSSNTTRDPNTITEAGNAPLLGKKLFRNKVLGAFTMIPYSLSDRLFEVLDTEHSGQLSLKNVLSGLAWLKHGTRDEHVQLLFIIYDLERVGEVSREVLDRFMDVIYGRERARQGSTVQYLDRVFDGRAAVDFHEFRQMVLEKNAHGDALLVKWLTALADKIGAADDPEIVALEQTYDPVFIRQRIVQTTAFSLLEVTALEKQFQQKFDAKGGASSRIPSCQFVEGLSANGLFPKDVLERFGTCTAMPNFVQFDELCQFLSDFCRGVSNDDKVHHLFHIYSDQSTRERVDFGAMKDLIHVGMNCDTSGSNIKTKRGEGRHVEEVR